MMPRIVRVTALAVAVGSLSLAAQQPAAPRPVTNQDLLDGLKDPTKWLTFGGNYSA